MLFRFILPMLAAGVCLAQSARTPPTVEDAKAFIEKAESTLDVLNAEQQQTDWVKSTYITDDTEAIAARADEKLIGETVRLVHESQRFTGLKLPEDIARKFLLLRLSLTVAAPSDAKETAELSRILASMEGSYGKGKYCPDPGSPLGTSCLDVNGLERIMAESHNPKELAEAWRGWHTISRPIRAPFERYVELANKGAKELGFADTGAMWRAKYDMTPDEYAHEVDRLWNQVKPLYLALHAYVRTRLRQQYGDIVPANGPIPAELLGNLWAQEWGNLYPMLAPEGADPGYDLTAILRARNTDAKQMVRYGEGFFTSLGFAPLPLTFWQRSQFTKPRDRDVVCHASAWDVDLVDDLRVKMCLEITDEDFMTVHHELGHNFYQRAYDKQPFLFRDGANDGFHEAIGDAIALSITPVYLKKLGFINDVPDASKDIGLLLKRALDKVAFLPFGLMVDKWRWEVFSGQIPPSKYNEAWWALKREYQGVAAPGTRSEQDFDPGAKYHVPANTPYSRYFLAAILQFQFHRAFAAEAGCKDPLNRCSIFGSSAAGAKLAKMLEMGTSRPWPDALEAGTGQRRMDATAIVDYFAPLKKWLDEQNKGKPVGW
ncbi:MAG TPA: M2 family metallopeptidase [Bryobacteraceae bacterium]|jgi:peptidyl-dipeptidase A